MSTRPSPSLPVPPVLIRICSLFCARVLTNAPVRGPGRAQLASEKRRRRRESHNAVERRRRDNINEKISELATLIPEIMLDPNTGGAPPSVGQTLFAISSQGSAVPVAEEGSPGADGQGFIGDDGDEKSGMKANKGIILKKSVEYIRYLQQLITAQASRNSELEAELAQLRSPTSPTDVGSSGGGFGFGAGSGPNLFEDLLLASPTSYDLSHGHGHGHGHHGHMGMGMGMGMGNGGGHAGEFPFFFQSEGGRKKSPKRLTKVRRLGMPSTSTESDEDMRSNSGLANGHGGHGHGGHGGHALGSVDEEERGRARTRSNNLGAGVTVKQEDIAMDV
ncbi:hypothetical protein BKA62DRAFT_623033 [Auriculariales sp. MPI-PUGE-AT-0066]|nr:hypothetical protein BKA62DRAFT_623033 [Auriculariales sp. MPI-PUGE-AT-0066]